MSRRIPSLIAIVVGFVGLLACAILVVATWSVSARIHRAIEDGFDSFASVSGGAQERLASLADRVDALKLSAEDVNATLKTWTEKKMTTSLEARLQIAQHANRLEADLNQTTRWLEALEGLFQLVQRMLESGRTLGIPLKPETFDSLLSEIAAVHASLSEVTTSVAGLGTQIGQLDDETDADRLSQIVNITTRLVATFGSIDERLDALDARVSEVDGALREAKTTVLSRIRLLATVITLLICWMAAGQGSLLYVGIRGWKNPTGAAA